MELRVAMVLSIGQPNPGPGTNLEVAIVARSVLTCDSQRHVRWMTSVLHLRCLYHNYKTLYLVLRCSFIALYLHYVEPADLDYLSQATTSRV